MTFNIQHSFDNDGSQPAHNCGAYIRKVGGDMGTGIVVGVLESDVLDEKTQKVFHQRVYHVHWLDMNDGLLYSFHPENELAPSARGVPKFKSEEEAEEWMERQVNPGHWVDGVQDAADSSADVDVALWNLLNTEN
jgi:hypothetical protein